MLETSARSQSEALSHSMWVLSGLLGLIRRDGYLPSDPLLFQQLVRSVSMGLANQANFAASYTTFFVKKRRDLLLSYLPPVFQDVQKKALSKAPTCFSSSLFPPEELHSLVESAKAMAQFKSQQALADSLSKSSRNRSPRRSSPDSYRRRYSRSPSRSSRSPKRVRFDLPKGSSAKSPPPPSSNNKSNQNFRA